MRRKYFQKEGPCHRFSALAAVMAIHHPRWTARMVHQLHGAGRLLRIVYKNGVPPRLALYHGTTAGQLGYLFSPSLPR